MAKHKLFIPGLSFSIKRAVGITAMKQKIARATGVPLTPSGRQRKVGAAIGCATVLALPLVGLLLTLLTLAMDSWR